MPFLPEDLYGCRRLIESKSWLGYEFYIKTPIANWTAVQAEVLKRRDSQKPLALDFGGASGYRAMRLAKIGFNVNVIDLTDDQETIRDRNNFLAENSKANGRISLFVSDVRMIDAAQLEKICKGQKPSVVTAYNLIHFLKFPDVERFLGVVSQTAARGSVFSLSYDTEAKDTPLIEHVPKDIVRAAQDKGFDKEHEISKGSYIEHGFRLNRPLETPSL